MAVIMLLELCILVFAKYYYDTFRTQIYIKIGASQDTQKLYYSFSYFKAFLKIYICLCIATFLTFFFFFEAGKTLAYIVDALVIVLLIALFLLG